MSLICLLAGSASKFGESSIKADELEVPVASIDGRRERGGRKREMEREKRPESMSSIKTKEGMEVFHTRAR